MKTTIKSTKRSSGRYGPCEVCGRHASEVYIRRIGANHVFGHKNCLRTDRTSAVLAACERFLVRHHGLRDTGGEVG